MCPPKATCLFLVICLLVLFSCTTKTPDTEQVQEESASELVDSSTVMVADSVSELTGTVADTSLLDSLYKEIELNIIPDIDKSKQIWQYLLNHIEDHSGSKSKLYADALRYSRDLIADLDSVLHYEKERLRIYKEVYINDQSKYVEKVIDFGDFFSMEYPMEAAKYLKSAIKLLGDDSPVLLAECYYELGRCLMHARNYDYATKYFETSIEIKERNGLEVGRAYGSLGFLYLRINDAENKAIKNFNKGRAWLLETNQEKSPTYMSMITGLMAANIGKKNFDEAEKYMNERNRLTKEIFGENHLQTITNQSIISILNYYKGDFEESVIYTKKYINELKNSKIPNSDQNIAGGYRRLAAIQETLAQYEQSLRSLDTALYYLGYNEEILLDSFEIDGFSLGHEVELKLCLWGKSKGLISSYKYIEPNIEFLKKAEKYLDIVFRSNISNRKNGYAMSSVNDLYNEVRIELYKLLSVNNTSILHNCFFYSEFEKSLKLKEVIRLSDVDLIDQVDNDLTSEMKSIQREISEEEKKLFQANSNKDTADELVLIRKKLLDLYSDLDSCVNIFKTNYPEFYNLRYNQNVISITGVQDSLLTPNQALLEYFVGDSSIFTFTILKDTFYVNEIKKDFPLDSLVKDMLQGIYDPFVSGKDHQQSSKRYTNAAHQIYQKIVAPVDALLPENTELIIIPEGILGYIPFDALLVEVPHEVGSFVNYHYLLKDHQISYAYSATLLKEMRYRKHRKEPVKNILAFAPSFNKGSITRDTAHLATRYIDVSNNRNWLGPLKYNGEEVKAIDSLIGADVYLDSLATEDRFTSLAGDYRILHLSTHGKANDKVGDYSFLAFYEQDDSLENEWLYNRELYNLELNADMVVLSACETGIGELQRGEGIISLARGFSYAGAKSIITTLWSVNDQSSKQLMQNFYSHLKTGKTKDAALRQAKLDYLENNAHMGMEPFFWAGVIPIGDMSPVVLSSSWGSWWWYGLLGLGIFGFLFFFFRYK